MNRLFPTCGSGSRREYGSAALGSGLDRLPTVRPLAMIPILLSGARGSRSPGRSDGHISKRQAWSGNKLPFVRMRAAGRQGVLRQTAAPSGLAAAEYSTSELGDQSRLRSEAQSRRASRHRCPRCVHQFDQQLTSCSRSHTNGRSRRRGGNRLRLRKEGVDAGLLARLDAADRTRFASSLCASPSPAHGRSGQFARVSADRQHVRVSSEPSPASRLTAALADSLG